ncbi:PTS sugar transporter subunit IIA [Pleomorphomonas sp. NRK KF1]|uniref:PTS sugar transporter subunit IIA n=1 Tax=Pleomorphomonas sp. NRK KF1 TaxID=2943000 RepID=UPI002042F56F|nr:PTS sugar transporter subunit IIA [Pleomorphomonas sp. NRK KF1]MCM5552345.1 PTS sugar transporter subunit IIA [Pleomorphomonas sp. NRK KF1]
MELADLIEPQDVFIDRQVTSKAELLRDLAHLASGRTGIDLGAILDPLIARERLGSTGIGNGVAIPHANVPDLASPFSLLARLRQPIDFEAIDETPVDVVFLALSPAHKGSSHLGLLATIARNARSAAWLHAVRQAPSPAELHALLAAPTS